MAKTTLLEMTNPAWNVQGVISETESGFEVEIDVIRGVGIPSSRTFSTLEAAKEFAATVMNLRVD